MSAGTPIHAVRIPIDLVMEMDIYLYQRECRGTADPMNKSEFIIAAIKEKIDHIKRSRRRKGSYGDRQETPCPPKCSQDNTEHLRIDDASTG